MEDTAVREALEGERDATLARIGAMGAEFDEIVAAAEGSNSDDEHDPEGSTIAFERAKAAALLLAAQGSLRDVDLALTRLEAGIYWTCERCDGAIAPERLAARPATRTCISCAAALRPGA